MSIHERKPKWAWSSVDDPHPDYPTCDRCDAFARWSIARHENEFDPMGGLAFTVRWFACGTHINAVLTEEDWWLDEVHVYDLTVPPERS